NASKALRAASCFPPRRSSDLVEGRIVLVNKAIGSMLGRNSESLIGQMHVEAGRNASLSNLIEQSLKTKKEIRDEIHFYYPKERIDRKSTRLNSSHVKISYAVF